jgi:hypothetical protein
MVMPELSILFTKKNKQNGLMERLVLQQVLVPLERKKIYQPSDHNILYAKNQPKCFTQL